MSPSPLHKSNRSNEVAAGRRALDVRHGQEPPPPFPGWHSRGYLPHCDKPGLIQLVTFRLGDAMPSNRRHEWEKLLAIEDERERRTKLEAYLDKGHGTCHLKRPEIAAIVEVALHYHDADRYRLCAWVIMPNHVHVIFEVWDMPMNTTLYTWKKFTAGRINSLLGRSGRLWQREYWDRYMRDAAHFEKARCYVESNPVKAGLCARAEDWPWSSANPKWTWNSGQVIGTDQVMTRYHGGHLFSQNWKRFLERARMF
jgi:REP element-mobilizing transposase RayT